MICRYNGTEIEVDDKIVGGFKEYLTGEKEVRKRLFRLSSGQEINIDDELCSRYEKSIRPLYKEQLELWIEENQITHDFDEKLTEIIDEKIKEQALDMRTLEMVLARRTRR